MKIEDNPTHAPPTPAFQDSRLGPAGMNERAAPNGPPQTPPERKPDEPGEEPSGPLVPTEPEPDSPEPVDPP